MVQAGEPWHLAWCPACEEERQTLLKHQQAAEAHAKLESRWVSIAPKIYRTSDLSRFSEELRALAMSWRSIEGRGLVLAGETGRSKTRCCFEILRRHHFDGMPVYVAGACEHAAASHEQFSDDENERTIARRILKRSRTAELLLFDDVGKAKLDGRAGAEFYQLVEHRTARGLATLMTSNMSGRALELALGGDRGKPVLRRILETSDVVTV